MSEWLCRHPRWFVLSLAGLLLAMSLAAVAQTSVVRAQNASDAKTATTPRVAASGIEPVAQRALSPPSDPVAASAYGVLERHCARCHQGGKLQRTSPAAAFGNILRLDEISNSPHLVQPGNPDGSRLYLMMRRRLMPPEESERKPDDLPTPAEIGQVRAWIEKLPPRTVCQDRKRVTAEDHASALAATASTAGKSVGRLRFVSIAHLHNACVPMEELAAYRQAVVRLFNSLSWKSTPIAVAAVDPAKTLFRVDLDHLGWLPEHWERIVRSSVDPFGLAPEWPAALRSVFGTPLPVVRADWFADTVMRAPLYYEVLGLPLKVDEIERILRADRVSTGSSAVIQHPAFGLQPTILERIQARAGHLWSTYHSSAVAAANGQPADPEKSSPPGEISRYRRAMFTLPNGLPAFFVADQSGDRLDVLPHGRAEPSMAGASGIAPGLGCLTCHATGPAIRPPQLDPSPYTADLDRDRMAVADALRRSGIDPALTLDGLDPLVALASQYARPLDAVRATAEMGVEIGVLQEIGAKGEAMPAVLARRLLQGIVSRREIERHGRDLIAALGRTLPNQDQAAPSPRDLTADDAVLAIDPGPAIILTADKPRYTTGEQLHVTVRTSRNCHLTLVSVDRRGRGTVIFPSDFEAETLVSAGRERRVPAAGAPYSFRLNEPGREHIVAACNEVDAKTDGIEHDFERQRFTDLGNYATFVEQSMKSPPAKLSPGLRSVEAQRRRRRVERQAEDAAPVPQNRIGRAAISIFVEEAGQR